MFESDKSAKATSEMPKAFSVDADMFEERSEGRSLV